MEIKLSSNSDYHPISQPGPYVSSNAPSFGSNRAGSPLFEYHQDTNVPRSNPAISQIHKNTKRHTAHTIVPWPNPKQWVIVHTSDLMMIIRQSIYILPIISRKWVNWKHNPTYCIMDNWDNMPYLTRQNWSDRHFISSMSSDKFAQWWLWDGVMYKQTNKIAKTKRVRLFALIINCTIIMKTNSRFSRNVYAISNRIWCNKHNGWTELMECTGKHTNYVLS